MPVVEVPLAVLAKSFSQIPLEEVLTSLPFIGLDIEGRDDKVIRLEYSPNRPDFSSYIGIVRALKGHLGLEIGLPVYRIKNDKRFQIEIDGSCSSRPYIRALVVKNVELDNDLIKMLIDMQEDLHMGPCNKRKAASIGLHNLGKIRFPLSYSTASPEVSFVPLDSSKASSLNEILDSTEMGKKYSHLFGKRKEFPILLDDQREVVSFPPIVNSKYTKLDNRSKGIFVEVTAVDPRIADLIIAIYASTFFDMNFQVYHVGLKEIKGSSTKSPDMSPSSVSASFFEINGCLGTKFPQEELIGAAARSRLGTRVSSNGELTCFVPKYRNDVREVRDLIEEVLIGLGISKLSPTLPVVNVTGGRNASSVLIDKIKEVLVGLGLLEIRNFIIVSSSMQFDSMGLKPEESSFFKLENSLLSGHDILRNSLLPSLISTIGHNIHSPYPQNIFEIGKVFIKGEPETEKWHLCVVLAYSKADYTSIRSILQALLKVAFGKEVGTTPLDYGGGYASGRSASILVGENNVGKIGEISDFVKRNHRIRVPVAAFELDLTFFLNSFRTTLFRT
ncbi:MAG TPA: phenylalanine--tRNA ligase subunit beta [Nitrososphaeraceae archaeon]|nr:phenylalanine--tRNA ligase subunit beta [Nitrososphaeraceae archaeon]